MPWHYLQQIVHSYKYQYRCCKYNKTANCSLSAVHLAYVV